MCNEFHWLVEIWVTCRDLKRHKNSLLEQKQQHYCFYQRPGHRCLPFFFFFKLCVKLNEPVQTSISSLRIPRSSFLSISSLYLIICGPRVSLVAVQGPYQFLYRSIITICFSLQGFHVQLQFFETVGYTVTVWFFKHLKDFVTDDLMNFTCSR